MRSLELLLVPRLEWICLYALRLPFSEVLAITLRSFLHLFIQSLFQSVIPFYSVKMMRYSTLPAALGLLFSCSNAQFNLYPPVDPTLLAKAYNLTEGCIIAL